MSDHNPVEITGNIIVFHPVKAEVIPITHWWNPHQRECDSLARPRADCDCSEDLAA